MIDANLYLDRARSEAELAQRNLNACAWNAAVNSDGPRARKKMGDLIRALNWHHRCEGTVKLLELIQAGVIEDFDACSDECMMRPGGLFHRDACPNDPNSPVFKDRQRRAQQMLPGGDDGRDGWRAADVTLVGDLHQFELPAS